MSGERDQFIFDVFITAIEGGVQLWADVSNYRWQKPGSDDEDLAGFEAKIEVMEPALERLGLLLGVSHEERIIDRDTITTGIDRICGSTEIPGIGPEYRARIASAVAVNDGGAVDAYAAAVIVQIGLFNEVIYG